MSGRRRKPHESWMYDRKPDAGRRSTALRNAADCPSGKMGYDSKHIARVATARATSHHGEPLGVYRCHHCGRWHKTSKLGGTTVPVSAKARRVA